MSNQETNAAEKLYAPRDTEELGELYLRHVMAMTSEKLHEKSHIAAELAWRDKQIADLKKTPAQLDEVGIVMLVIEAGERGYKRMEEKAQDDMEKLKWRHCAAAIKSVGRNARLALAHDTKEAEIAFAIPAHIQSPGGLTVETLRDAMIKARLTPDELRKMFEAAWAEVRQNIREMDKQAAASMARDVGAAMKKGDQ